MTNSHRLKSFQWVSDLRMKNSIAEGKLTGNFINHTPAIPAEF
jgi:hypothetical protein